MSRLTELLRQARKADTQLGADLEAEIAQLLKRRSFGLVFERHQPEAVELPGRTVRHGDKVRVLPLRGEANQVDQGLWRVERIERIERSGGQRVAHLKQLDAEEPETKVVLAEDLVVVAEFQDRIYPGLVETSRVERGGDKPFHTVINAENYHALEMLTYTHRHSIDAIYIDPPYNTGAKDWKYNNNYVEGDDDYRHSKWLAFMDRRLQIARELLNPENSVLIVTIDEKEIHRLALLLEQTFPEARIQMVSSVIAQKGVARKSQFYRTDEYVFYVAFGDAHVIPQPLSSEWNLGKKVSAASKGIVWSQLRRASTNSRRVDRPNLFYPILFPIAGDKIAATGDPLPLHQERESYVPPPGFEVIWPLKPNGSEGNWQLSPKSLMAVVEKGYVRLGAVKNGDGVRTVSYLKPESIKKIETGQVQVTGRDPKYGHILVDATGYQREFVPGTQWNISSHDATYHGTQMLTRFLPDRKFPFPKSLYAVEDALRFFVQDKPVATILDFFSGSGTTAHAVMRLNRQDGGIRQCISITNNEVSADEQKKLRQHGLRPGDPEWEELGICDYITKPRLRAAITGRIPGGDPVEGEYRFTDEFPMSDGFEENAAFFTLTYEAPLSVRHNRAFERIAPMLWLRAGAQGRIIMDLGEDGWDVTDRYGVLENLDQAGEFLTCVSGQEPVRTVFIVTDDDSAFQMFCRDLPNQVLPIRLYESYLQNFEINTGGR